jgi:hypothetical protein
MRRLPIIAFLFLLLCATAAAAQSANAAGTWDTILKSPQGEFNIQLILKQDGEKVSGVVKSANGELPIEGTANGKDIKLKYTIKFQGNDMLITLAGAQDGASIKGSADYGGLAEGEFSAKRASDAGAASSNSAAPASTPSASAPSASGKTDISGAWFFQVETSAGSGSPTFTFKQDGEKLTGQYKGAFGEAPLTGSVKGNKVGFTIKVDAQGQQVTINYSGTIEKDGSMKGTADLGEAGSGTWTGKRQ